DRYIRGLPILCRIELRMGSHGNLQAYKDLWQCPELIQCYRVTGDPCVLMRAAVDSMPLLEDLINCIA
ncbi:Lrp/AsnC ligand binding domain-containing protein, partial [Pseudomonas syringae pv. tagetis]